MLKKLTFIFYSYSPRFFYRCYLKLINLGMWNKYEPSTLTNSACICLLKLISDKRPLPQLFFHLIF